MVKEHPVEASLQHEAEDATCHLAEPGEPVIYYHFEPHPKFCELLVDEFSVAGQKNVFVIDTPGAGAMMKACLRRNVYAIVLSENEAAQDYLKDVARQDILERIEQAIPTSKQ